MTKPESRDDWYRIGAVARLTGVPPVTLRAWERRYGAVTTVRQEGRARMYSREDVERLTLIKRLVDLGNAISTVATLSLAELARRVHRDAAQVAAQEAASGIAAPLLRAGLLGVALPIRLRDGAAEGIGLEVAVAETRAADFAAACRQSRPDLLLLEYPTVQADTVEEIVDFLAVSGAARAIVVYGFARKPVLASLEQHPVTALRAPVGLAELGLAVRSVPASGALPRAATRSNESGPTDSTGSGVAPARFSPVELERFSSESSTVACECPRHLAELVIALSAFETYSAQCVSLSPEDAELHSWLYRTTGRARAMMEEALERIARQDGLI